MPELDIKQIRKLVDKFGSVSVGSVRIEKIRPEERKCPGCGRTRGSWPRCGSCGRCVKYCCNIGVGLCPGAKKRDDEQLRHFGWHRCPRCKWVVEKDAKRCGHCRLAINA